MEVTFRSLRSVLNQSVLVFRRSGKQAASCNRVTAPASPGGGLMSDMQDGRSRTLPEKTLVCIIRQEVRRWFVDYRFEASSLALQSSPSWFFLI